MAKKPSGPVEVVKDPGLVQLTTLDGQLFRKETLTPGVAETLLAANPGKLKAVFIAVTPLPQKKAPLSPTKPKPDDGMEAA